MECQPIHNNASVSARRPTRWCAPSVCVLECAHIPRLVRLDLHSHESAYLSLSPSLPLSLTPSRPLSLSPSLPLPLSPTLTRPAASTMEIRSAASDASHGRRQLPAARVLCRLVGCPGISSLPVCLAASLPLSASAPVARVLCRPCAMSGNTSLPFRCARWGGGVKCVRDPVQQALSCAGRVLCACCVGGSCAGQAAFNAASTQRSHV
jgi:hypothetical protein